MEKIELFLWIIYKHARGASDFPIRLRFTASDHFLPSGKSEVDAFFASPKDLEDEKGAPKPFMIRLVLKRSLFSDEKATRLPPGSSVLLTVCCPLKNGFGKLMWRSGGSCHFPIGELRRLRKPGPQMFTLRTVRNSAYGVDPEDRATGFPGVSPAENCKLDAEIEPCMSKPHRKPPTQEHFLECVEESFSKYKKVLVSQDRLVTKDERTKNMRCPWTPMDTCVWEVCKEYDNEHLFSGTHGDEDVETKGALIGSKNWLSLPQITDEPASIAGWWGKGGTSGQTANYDPPSFDGFQKRGAEEAREPITYLPYFAYCMFQPVKMQRNYWVDMLSIHADRKKMTLEKYAAHFSSGDKSPGWKAGEAVAVISAYAQSLEYVSDFYIPGASRNDRCKKETEQFWNALIGLGGDCEDSQTAHRQMYEAFVKNSWKDPKINDVISSHPVLKEMRALLAKNYVAMSNIESVYLPKQSASAKPRERSERRNYAFSSDGMEPLDPRPEYFDGQGYCGFSREFADGDYEFDTAKVNSAHAAIKLIPKKYFERCVNRCYLELGKKPAFPFRPEGETPNEVSCCFYHSHPPDRFNDELPVLFVEGTSMLFCRDTEPDECPFENFKDVLCSDPVIGDAGRSPIYARRGESSFYGASLFGTTLDFIKHGTATFTYARANPNGGSFIRGASHRQLSLKSESVVLVPYGLTEPFVRETASSPESHLSECARVHFESTEVSHFMSNLCSSECGKRTRARKIRAASKPPRGEREYDHFSTEGGSLLEDNRKLLTEWCEKEKAKCFEPLTDRPNGAPFELQGRFHYYINNYYITPKFLDRLQDVYERALAAEFGELPFRRAPETPKTPTAVDISATLETLSLDVRQWRIDFEFYRAIAV